MTTERPDLTATAAGRIRDTGRQLLPEERAAATALLADLYAVGLRHGIGPQDWSWVASLGNDCIDAIKQRARRQQQSQRERGSRELSPVTEPHREQAGRELW